MKYCTENQILSFKVFSQNNNAYETVSHIINKIQSNNIEKLINYKMTEKNKRVSDKIIQDLKQKINIDEKTPIDK